MLYMERLPFEEHKNCDSALSWTANAGQAFLKQVIARGDTSIREDRAGAGYPVSGSSLVLYCLNFAPVL